jgi:hypothetical protein
VRFRVAAQRHGSRARPGAQGYTPLHGGNADLGDIATRPDRLEADLGEASYRKSLALAEPLKMRPLIAHCHLGLRRLGRLVGRHRRAREHLILAATMYREMGMAFWLARADAELRS